ncbi:restriction endonuclease subunit S [uncultured Akkermansia sp.]|uniref:restriction endonuclease subunit S n=1 Tax=uncultured Akkermansia sp. TaxID=512294 RepID=UPI00259A75C2|nr:restriction endonuclease subunit S [uncultured Akkermansia sp.]
MNTKKLRQKILDLAIHGKLVPQDPNDEPASVLLERIKAEKERLIKEGKIKKSKKSAKTSDTPHYENVPFEVPEGWMWCKLENCCHIAGRIGFRGYTKNDLVAERQGAITLSPSNIIDGTMNYDKCTYISWNKYEESPEIKVANGDILLVKTGSSYGKCALVAELPQNATINPQFVVLKNISINEQYLIMILQSDYARRNYNNFVLGTAIPTFTQAVLGNMLIPLPPISEQQRIVAEIEKWVALIDQIEQGKADLQTAIRQTKSKILNLAIHGKLVQQDPNDEPAIELLKRINPDFTPCDNGHYPIGWQQTILGELFNHNTGKALNSSNKEGAMKNYLTTSNVYWNKFDFTVIKQMPFKENELDKCTVTKGDLLVCEGGDIGRSAIWNYDYDICIQNHIHRLRPKIDLCVPFYYYTLAYLKENNLIGGKGIGLLGLSSNALHKIEIPLPPFAEQQRIVQKIEDLFSVLDNIQNALEV